MKTSFHFDVSPIYVDSNDLDPAMYEAWKGCGGVGDQTDNVNAFMEAYSITGLPWVLKIALASEGAWTSEELEDHDENLRRVVWIFGSMFRENEEYPEDDTLTMLGE